MPPRKRKWSKRSRVPMEQIKRSSETNLSRNNNRAVSPGGLGRAHYSHVLPCSQGRGGLRSAMQSPARGLAANFGSFLQESFVRYIGHMDRNPCLLNEVIVACATR